MSDTKPQSHAPNKDRLQQFLNARLDKQEAFPETQGHLCLHIAAELWLGSGSGGSRECVSPRGAAPAQLRSRGAAVLERPPPRQPAPLPAPLAPSGIQTHSRVSGGSEPLPPAMAWPLPTPQPRAAGCAQYPRPRTLSTRPNTPGQKKPDCGDLHSLTLKP